MKSSYEIRVLRLNEVPFEQKLDSPACMAEYWNTVIAKMPWFIPDREICVSVTLNTRYNVTGHSLVSIGSLNESVVGPREVFRSAVAMNAYAILIAHNHPSGDPSPSEADHRVTRRLAEVGKILQINLLDHIIIGNGKWFSFKEAGVI